MRTVTDESMAKTFYHKLHGSFIVNAGKYVDLMFNEDHRKKFFDVLGDLKAYANPDVYGLDREETEILRARLGVYGYVAYTTKELSLKYNKSEKEISKIEINALKKLRSRITRGYYDVIEALKIGNISRDEILNNKIYTIGLNPKLSEALIRYSGKCSLVEVIRAGLFNLSELDKRDSELFMSFVTLVHELGYKFNDEEEYFNAKKEKQEAIDKEYKIIEERYLLGQDGLTTRLKHLKLMLKHIKARIATYDENDLKIKEKRERALNRRDNLEKEIIEVENKLDDINKKVLSK